MQAVMLFIRQYKKRFFAQPIARSCARGCLYVEGVPVGACLSIVLYVCVCNAHLGAGRFFAFILQALMNNLYIYALSV